MFNKLAGDLATPKDMNSRKLKNVISLYKTYFKEISNQEIYKWQAVKCFQDNWSIDAEDFPDMLERSLKKAKNLLASGYYYPKKMVINNSKIEPEKVKKLFKSLYESDTPLIYRVKKFREDFIKLNSVNFPGKNHFQDDRAIMVYLCLRYPEDFYLYKYEMFRKFVSIIDYAVQPKQGKIENLLVYETLCELIKGTIENDHELIKLHQSRIGTMEYDDEDLRILTQDIIYAATYHIEKFNQTSVNEVVSNRLLQNNVLMTPITVSPSLVGIVTDHAENAKEKKKIGTLGELLVLEFEKQLVKSYKIKKEVIHSSEISGDGLGYDILSYDELGGKKYIEVKTTKSGDTTPFYITATELQKSNLESENYYLYRLYHYNEETNSASFYIFKGSLSALCTNPVVYKTILNVDDTKHR